MTVLQKFKRIFPCPDSKKQQLYEFMIDQAKMQFNQNPGGIRNVIVS